MCMQVSGGGGPFMVPPRCCADEEEGICGSENMAGECEPPPELDERCPSVTILAGTPAETVVNPCCTAEGMCGVDSSAIGMGCVDLGTPSFRMFAPNAPEPRRCDGADEDAGM